MTTKQLIGQIRKTRVINKSHFMTKLKKDIDRLRKDIVFASFQPELDREKHKGLLKQLKAAQARYAEASSHKH